MNGCTIKMEFIFHPIKILQLQRYLILDKTPDVQ